MNISTHISYKEGVYSRTAMRLGIENKPIKEQMNNMHLIAEQVFEPLRDWVGGPIKINSFFRSPKLNTAIGGSTRSQHCHGQAIDIDDTFGRATNAEMYDFIKKKTCIMYRSNLESLPLSFHSPSYTSPFAHRQVPVPLHLPSFQCPS